MPRILVIVIVAPPGNIYSGVGDDSETSGVYCFFKGLLGISESVLEYACQGSSGFSVGINHCVDSLKRDLKGFLAYHVFARFSRSNSRFHVESTWRGDGDNIYFFALEHIPVVFEGPGIEFVRQFLGPVQNLVAAGC